MEQIALEPWNLHPLNPLHTLSIIVFNILINIVDGAQ